MLGSCLPIQAEDLLEDAGLWYTLPPIVMDMENSLFGDKPHIFQDTIFHFHDYGRKSNMITHSTISEHDINV